MGFGRRAQAKGNLKLAKAEATNILKATDEAVTDYKLQSDIYKRNQLAAQGAAGARVGAGSPLELRLQEAKIMAEDVIRIQQRGQYAAEKVKKQGELGVKVANIAVLDDLLGLGQTFLAATAGGG